MAPRLGNGATLIPPKSLAPRRPHPHGWQDVYVKTLRQTGGFYLAAEKAGLSHDAAERFRASNPDFEGRCQEAFQLWADDLQCELRDGASQKHNPVPHIVLLKKARPSEYIERTVNLSLDASMRIEPEIGLELVKSLLGIATPATIQAIPADTAQDAAQPAQVVDSQGPDPVTLPAENHHTP